jgi:hypothetical protein
MAALAGAGCSIDLSAGEFTARERKTFPVREDSTPIIELATFDGRVEVRGWDRPQVSIEIERAGRSRELVDAMAVQANQTGDKIQVEAVAPSGERWGGVLNTSHYVNLSASVPRHCLLRVRSGDGSIRVEQVDGQLDAETGDGSVRGLALSGDIRVRSGDGSIKLETVDGQVTADTGDGSIAVAGRLKGIKAISGDGSIAIRLEEGSLPDRDWHITTQDGSISLELPEQFAATIDASTGAGVVRAEESLGLPAATHPARALRGTLGNAAHVVRIRSGDGSISLRRQ